MSMYATSIYTPESHVVYPLSEARKQPAPPMPEGSISVDAVPAAPRQQPMPLMRLAVPIIMVVAIGAVIGLMLMSGQGDFSPHDAGEHGGDVQPTNR